MFCDKDEGIFFRCNCGPKSVDFELNINEFLWIGLAGAGEPFIEMGALQEENEHVKVALLVVLKKPAAIP